MSDFLGLGRLGRRLLGAFLAVAITVLAVHFIGTVIPHLAAGAWSAEDAVSPQWLLAATAVALAAAVLTSVFLARRMTAPIEAFISAARSFADGDHSARPSDVGGPELAEVAAALTAAAEEVERSERARRQLTADIAHELRTPLTALQAGLEELRDGLVPADHSTLSGLHDQAARLGRIVNDLNELAAAESQGLQLRSEPVDLARVADLAIAAREGSMASAGLKLSRDLAPDVAVLADTDRLHQIVGNLLANTVLYCRPGDTVTVNVRGEGDRGVLEVRDTGPGFRPEELPRVFDRSWRGTSADGTIGSGLGLPIVRALTLAQGGTVQILPNPDGGAAIRIDLPRVSH